ncbi:MAG: 3-methyl-2-oxobutanoate dehydrogenase subunit VorB [Acidobacteriota bacterium]|nr:MAG: 3-methyl-2-oxobutanoate dehydrogenase subunit VorB [Acidobacteriota bacterium]
MPETAYSPTSARPDRPPLLIKGNEAIVKGALLAGCRCFFGYPITPASEIAETAARDFPAVGGVFVQAESETAAMNMVYGAASAGVRTMTASSGPGISLMQEAVSYAAGSELPCVIVSIMRGGPGLGNIAPEQADYNQVVRIGGHGNYRNPVYAPSSGQEMCDLTMRAFEVADRYRNPVYVLADGFVGQMMEPVAFPDPLPVPPEKDWAVRADAETRKNLISSIYLEPDELEAHNRKLQAKYREIEENEALYDEFMVDDAKIVVVAYGIVARVARSAVAAAREEGIPAGLFRPVTLWPFPRRRLDELAGSAARLQVFELSYGQMLDDVRLAIHDRIPVGFHGRMGGNVPSVEECLEQIRNAAREGGVL